MLYNLVFAAAVVGSASAAVPAYGNYGGGYGGGYNGGGYNGGGESSSVPVQSLTRPVHSGGYGSEQSSSAPSMISYTGIASTAPSSSLGFYPTGGHSKESGYPSMSYPTGGYSYSYPASGFPSSSGASIPSGGPTGSGYSYSHLPPNSGSGINTYSHMPPSSGSGVSSYSHPIQTGSVPPLGPTNTGTGVTPNGPTAPPSQHTTTIYGGSGTTTSTKTVVGTTRITDTVTKYVPCSSPVGTIRGSTYYSSYLTVDYSTTTHDIRTTEIEVICPATAAPASPTGVPGGYESGSGNAGAGNQGPGQSSNVGGGQSGSEGAGQSGTSEGAGHYGTSTSGSQSGSAGSLGQSCPTCISCPAATTVYHTVAVTTTVTAGGASAPTDCAECTTYHITLPNGQPTSVIVPPTGGLSPSPTSTPYDMLPPYTTGTPGFPGGPTGTGMQTGTAVSYSTNTAPLPSGSGGYSSMASYGGYGSYYL